MNILRALDDPKLYGSAKVFEDKESWKPWRTFLAAVYGLPLDDEGLALFKECTGRSVYNPPPGGWREVACALGRQGGKTQISSLLVSYEGNLGGGDTHGSLYAPLVAQDWRASMRTAYEYICDLQESSPMLRGAIVNRTKDTLDLSNGTRIACYPCRPSSLRGVRARIVLLDEFAHFRNSEGNRVDTEMLRAVRPSLATTGGKLVMISSPYSQSGELWSIYKKHYGRDGGSVLVWQSSAPRMNPSLSPGYLQHMKEEDPEGYKSEVEGQFLAGVSTLLDPEAIERCVVPGRLEVPPNKGTRYSAFVDVSAGKSDAFTVAIGSLQDKRAVVDVLRAWEAPFNPSGVVAECADILKDYGVSRVVADRFAGAWVTEAFDQHGIRCEQSAKPKSDLYLDLVAFINGQRVDLLDDPSLLRELRMLERRRGSSGKDRVDHPAAAGAHDDRANAVAGLAGMLLKRKRGVTWTDIYGEDAPKQERADPPGMWTRIS